MQEPSKLIKTAKALEKSQADKQKRRAERVALMKRGMEDLEIWLCDIIRAGTASTEGQSYAFWQDFSARMVDTQLSALGPKIRSLQLLHHAECDWPDQMLQELGALYLLARGFRNLEQLPEEMQGQLLRLAGIRDQKDLLLQDGVFDHWGVLGQFEGINIDNGHFRRTWLRGAKTRNLAMIQEYDYQNRGYDTEWKLGGIYTGYLIYYPATYPQRAILKDPDLEEAIIRQMKGYPDTNAFLEDYADAITVNPWLPEFPCCLENITPILEEEQLLLIDAQQFKIPVHVKEAVIWQILALSGGHPITIFGEWTGEAFLPLSALVNQRFVALT